MVVKESSVSLKPCPQRPILSRYVKFSANTAYAHTPPATPISTASTIPTTSAAPLIRKAKPISAKFVPMAAAVMPSAGRASRHPSAPPTRASNVDSTTNAVSG